MGAMGVMALALSVVGGAIGAGLGVGALSGMWGIPAVVAVATVGVVTVGVVGVAPVAAGVRLPRAAPLPTAPVHRPRPACPSSSRW